MPSIPNELIGPALPDVGVDAARQAISRARRSLGPSEAERLIRLVSEELDGVDGVDLQGLAADEELGAELRRALELASIDERRLRQLAERCNRSRSSGCGDRPQLACGLTPYPGLARA